MLFLRLRKWIEKMESCKSDIFFLNLSFDVQQKFRSEGGKKFENISKRFFKS